MAKGRCHTGQHIADDGSISILTAQRAAGVGGDKLDINALGLCGAHGNLITVKSSQGEALPV